CEEGNFGYPLFMLDRVRSALPVERQDLQLPVNGNGRRHETDLAVAGLIVELAGNLYRCPIRAERIAEIGRARYLDVLPDAERSLKDRYPLLDCREVENFRLRIVRRLH